MKAVLAPDVVSTWSRARRFGVSPAMIERATERRLAGDWQGACVAANMDVTFDLDEVADRLGLEVAAGLLEDLGVLVPDLVRYHLPRHTSGLDTLHPKLKVVLASYGDRVGPLLYVRTPELSYGPQRLRLEVGYLKTSEQPLSWTTSRHLWDATKTDELRARCGGGERTPFFNADGSLARLPASDPGRTDPAAFTEWLTVLQESDRLAEACAMAGIELDTAEPKRRSGNYYAAGSATKLIKWWPFTLSTFADDVRRLAAWEDRHQYVFPLTYYLSAVIETGSSSKVVIRLGRRQDVVNVPQLPHAITHRLPDLDLLRAGKITPDRLHPLVRASLFPELPLARAPRYAVDPIRVRCQGVWHLIEPRDGVISGPHSEQEYRREQALQAFGGVASGCFRVRTAWSEGMTLPKRLRLLRKEIFGRARHGDAEGVIELLDAGIDVRVRDADKRTLLHSIHLLDHELLLRRLLDAGLDLEAKDHNGRTPLFVAVAEGGSVEAIKALIEAGARTDGVTPYRHTLRDVITQTKRTDLAFLLDALT